MGAGWPLMKVPYSAGMHRNVLHGGPGRYWTAVPTLGLEIVNCQQFALKTGMILN